MRGHKVFFWVVFSSLLLSVPLCAWAEEIPELHDWWSMEGTWSFGRDFSYLPNFDTARQGINAVAVYTRRSVDDTTSSTWYNRYFMDTVNQFTWQESGLVFSIVPADLNNDGATDYLTYRGHVFQGVEDKAPPLPRSVAQYSGIGFSRYGEFTAVMDVNNDGYEDIVENVSSYGGNRLLHILLGGKDLRKLKVAYVAKRPEHGYGEYFLGAFQKGEGDTTVKIVNLSYELVTVDGQQEENWSALVLREMYIQNVGDTVAISFRTLDSLWFDGYKSGGSTTPYSSKMFVNRKAGKEYLLARRREAVPPPDNRHWHAVLYELRNNKLHKTEDFVPIARTTSSSRMIGGDINGDGYDDWGIIGRDNMLYLYRGLREGLDSVPVAKYKLDAQRLAEAEGITILAIGDVTGDGVGDMAVSYDVSNGKFSIIKGEKLHPVGVEEPVAGYTPADFSMGQSYPNPIGAERTATLPVQIRRAGQYSVLLYSLQGKQIAVLYTGFLPAGTSQLPLQLSGYGLSAGFYVLRLGDGSLHTERGILLR